MFQLDSELKAVQGLAREFAENEIRPIALDLDQAPRGSFNWDIVKKGARIGLLAADIPERFGGSAGETEKDPLLRAAIVMEELAAACSGVATIFGAHGLGLLPILLSMDPKAWERFLPPIVEAAGTDRPKLCAFAITEPDAGSDVEDNEGSRYARLMTYAEKKGDYYVLNGRKCFISNGSVASLITVFAALDKKAGIDSWTCFAVTSDMEGFSVGRIEDKMGQRACPAAELIFDNLKVPMENVIGGEGGGWNLNQMCLNISRAPVGALAVGIARNAYEIALRYARERLQGGRRIIEHQAVGMMLADMLTNIDTSRLLVWNVCKKVQSSFPPPGKEPAMAKLFASDRAVEVALNAIQILGGYGYMRDYGVEKCLRDAKLTQIYEGTNQMQRLRILEAILKEAE